MSNMPGLSPRLGTDVEGTSSIYYHSQSVADIHYGMQCQADSQCLFTQVHSLCLKTYVLYATSRLRKDTESTANRAKKNPSDSRTHRLFQLHLTALSRWLASLRCPMETETCSS